MVFSSHIFIFYFLPLALAVYYAAPRMLKHLVLTLMSYLFYGWWNPWFVFLMLGSTIVDYVCGKVITAPGASVAKRKAGLLTSIIVNLSVLGFFKYWGFFQGNLNLLLDVWGQTQMPIFKVILPVGISFYTFQSMSYSIDLYRGHARPARTFLDFACYVSMFPQLVAGPIVRYGSIAEQLRHRIHSVEGFSLGVSRFMIGFAKKILLADSVAKIADAAFGSGEGVLNPATAWVGVLAYAFQIYFDFSGYSDMAIGLGRMFGFKFPENFNSPYRADSMTDFWRRWHISLSSFLRDYLYIPLGGNRLGPGRTYANLFITMLLGGLWHGAQWTFVVWGAIHGTMLALERLMGKTSFYSKLPRPLRITVTFIMVLFTWVFFRAANFEVARRYIAAMLGFGGDAPASAILQARIFTPMNILVLVICAAVVWVFPRAQDLTKSLRWPKAILLAIVFVLALAMMFYAGYSPFLYFQF